MKFRLTLTLSALLACFAALPAQAGFTSLHVFGDSISSTTGNNTPYPYSTNYYGKRYSNGRVWVEVLAQQQGLPGIAANNISYFGNTSSNVLKTVTNSAAAADASTALYVVWVNNADLLYAVYNAVDSVPLWTTEINKSLTNHFKIVTNLWGKGARTIIMPNAVDLSTIPEFNAATYINVIRQQCLAYNAGFANMLNQAKTKCPGLTILTPDYHTVLNNLLTNPAAYGVTNALNASGRNIGAVDHASLADKSLNGPGASYIFWDATDPSAKVHYIMASVAQQLITPAPAIPPLITKLTVQPNGSNRLDMVNLPPGMNGLVEGRTNLTQGAWTSVASFAGSSPTMTLFVETPPLPANFGAPPGSGGGGAPPMPGSGTGGSSATNTNNSQYVSFNLQLYRLSFPQTNWMWP